jgi:hypothetical protein
MTTGHAPLQPQFRQATHVARQATPQGYIRND